MVLGIVVITSNNISPTGLSPSLAAHPRAFNYIACYDLRSVPLRKLRPASLILQRAQAYTAQVFSSSRFAHHYSGNHIRFLFLTVLRCFSSRHSLPYPMYSDKDTEGLPQWVSPFGYLRIKA